MVRCCVDRVPELVMIMLAYDERSSERYQRMRKIKASWRFVSSNWGEFGFAFMGFLVVAGRWLAPRSPSNSLPMNHQSVAAIGQQVQSDWFLAAVACAFLFLLAKTFNSHRDRVYNPTLVSKFWDAFEKMEERKRAAAASACIDFLKAGDWGKVKEPERIEVVLDFLEDLGFNLKHKQMSIQLIHHHFDHWIRMYLQACESYISDYRKKEPTRWEHCGFLRRETDALEAERSNKLPEQIVLSKDDLLKYLAEEAGQAESNSSIVQA